MSSLSAAVVAARTNALELVRRARGLDALGWAHGALWLVALWRAAALAWQYGHHAALRLFEASAVDWVEPVLHRTALQVARGGPLYPAPSLDYIGDQYTPGMGVVHGLLVLLFGEGYPALRVFDFGLWLALVGLAARWVWTETRDWAWTAVWCVLALSLCDDLHGWFMTMNLEAPSTLAALGGFYLLRHPTPRRSVRAALLMALAFLFKPQGFLFAAGGFMLLAIGARRQLWRYGVVCAVAAGLVSLVLLLSSDGWFWAAVVRVTVETEAKPEVRLLENLLHYSSFGTWCFAAAVPLVLAATLARRGQLLPVVIFAACAAISTAASFGNTGGGKNVLFPLFFAGLLALGLVPALFSERRLLMVGFAALAVFAMETRFVRARRATAIVREAPSLQAARDRLFQRERSFETRLYEAVRRYGPEVYVEGRFAHGARLSVHRASLLNHTLRTGIVPLTEVMEPPLRDVRYRALFLWDAQGLPPIARLVSRYYRQVEDLGTDPLIGVRVTVWEPL